MATLTQLRAQLGPRLRMNETITSQATLLTGFIVRGVWKIQQEHEWPFLIQRDVTVAVSSSTTVLGLPSDFGEIIQIFCEDTSVTPANRWQLMQFNQPLPKPYWDTMFATNPTATSQRSKPVRYAVEWLSSTGQLILNPLPDAAYTLHLDYRRLLAELSADGDTNYFTVNYPNLCVDAATIEGMWYLNEKEGIGIAETLYRTGVRRAIDQTIPSSQALRMTWDPHFFGGVRRGRDLLKHAALR